MSSRRRAGVGIKSTKSLAVQKSIRAANKSFYNDEEVCTLVVIPPDGGWGWVVVFCSFACHFIIDGNIYTYGLFIQHISDEFDVKVAKTVLVGSVLGAMSYFVGPFVSACMNRYDFRLIAIIGCMIVGIAYTLSFLAWNYTMFLIAYGIVLGIGYGMLYVPALVIISLYFAKWRALAVSLATTGSGVGTLVMPQIISMIVNRFPWRYAYLFFIGFVGVAATMALAFRPVGSQKVVSKDKKGDRVVPGTSMAKFQEQNRKRCACCHWGNKYFPTTHEVIPHNEADLKNIYDDADDDFPGSSRTYFDDDGTCCGACWSSDCCNDCCYDCWESCVNCLCCEICHTTDRPMYRDDIFYHHSLYLINEKEIKEFNKDMKKKLKKQKEMVKAEASKKKKQEKEMHKEEEKKLKTKEEIEKKAKELEQKGKAGTSKAPSKEDEEKKKLKEEEQMQLRKYHMSVTHVTTARELESYHPCCWCDLSGIRTLTSMLDFHLFKSIAFLVLAFNGFFFTFGYMIPFLFIYDRAVEFGIEEQKANLLLSLIGLSNTIGRLLSGLLPCILPVNTTFFIFSTALVTGLITAFSCIYTDLTSQMIYACSYGLLSAPFMALRSVIIVEVFGLEDLTNIFGVQLVFAGIATMNGSTIAGFLKDVTHDYDYSFYLAGGCIALSSLMILIMKPIRTWEKGRQ